MRARSSNRVWAVRRGAIAIKAAVLIFFVLIGMVALAIDVGFIVLTRTEAQVVADAASLAAGTELLPGLGFDALATHDEVEAAAQTRAIEYADYHRNGDQETTYLKADPDQAQAGLEIDRDVRLGYAWYVPPVAPDPNVEGDVGVPGGWVKWYPTDEDEPPLTLHNGYNAVTVTVRRDQEGSENGDTPLPLFFGPLMGTETANVSAQATAAILPAMGFRPRPGATSKMTPFAFRKTNWDRRQHAQELYDSNAANLPGEGDETSTATSGPPAGPYFEHNAYDDAGNLIAAYNYNNPLFYRKIVDNQGDITGYEQDIFDNYTHNDDGHLPTFGADGVLEVNMYPEAVGASGNSGTVDLGDGNNSTDDLTRQILYGLNESDWEAMEEAGLLDENGVFTFQENTLEGDTGISNAIQSAMTQIIDDARVMLLFDAVIGSGNNAEYTVNGYTGVAVMNVLMSGNPKYIWVQPARVQDPTGVGDEDGIIDDETTVFAPLILIE